MIGEQATRDAMQADTSWRIDKRIPVTLLVAMIFQTFAVGVWVAKLDSRVGNLEANNVNPAAFAVINEKITQVQLNSVDTKQDIGAIKTDITNLKEEIRRSGFNGKR